MTPHWSRPSFHGRGARTAHLVIGYGRRTACGASLGYGNVVSADSETHGRCKRCTAHETKLASVTR